jgi:sugar-specific transcriptional regulator TrmB
VRHYFYMLSQLGLIEIAGGAPSKSGFRKRFYRVVAFKAAKGMRKKDIQEELDRILRAWHHPQMELYPGTGIGSTGYSQYKKKRERVPSGRNPEYT